MELAIPRDSDGTGFSWVKISFRDKYGLSIGNASYKPILDTHMYEAE